MATGGAEETLPNVFTAPWRQVVLKTLPNVFTADWRQVVLRTLPNAKRRREINASSGAANKTSKMPKGGSGSGKTNKAPADTFMKKPKSDGGTGGSRRGNHDDSRIIENHDTAVTIGNATLVGGGNSGAAAEDASAIFTKDGVQSPTCKRYQTATGEPVGA